MNVLCGQAVAHHVPGLPSYVISAFDLKFTVQAALKLVLVVDKLEMASARVLLRLCEVENAPLGVLLVASEHGHFDV